MEKRKLLVLGLAVGLLLGSVWLFRSGSRPVELRVHRAAGGSVVPGGKVLVAGRKLRIGQRIRVLEAPLYLVNGSNSLRLDPGSEVTIERIFNDNQLQLGYSQGAGTTTVNSGTVVHRWSDRVLRQTAGTLRWELVGDKLTLLVNDEFKGGWRSSKKEEGKLAVVERKKQLGSLKLPASHPAWHRKVGSVVEFEKFRNQLDSYLQKHGRPSSLLEVTGHWPRDAWGNVFLLRKTTVGLGLRSSGPDERMFTGDDRTARLEASVE